MNKTMGDTAERVCRITGSAFMLSQEELEHIERLRRLTEKLRFPVPLPDIHPLEELRRQFSFVNYMNLFHEKSALSGKPQLSRYSAVLGTKICTVDEFWSDAVDNSERGRNYDFSCPFFEQWRALYRDCFILPLNNFNAENSAYVNGTRNVKSCYLSFNTLDSEDCLYCMHVSGSRDLVSCVGARACELCYNSLDIEHCYGCEDCQDCKNSNHCVACLDVIGCRSCFGCVGLRNEEYCAFNEKLGKKEYEAFLSSLTLSSHRSRTAALARATDFIRPQGHTVNRLIKCEASSGNYLSNCKNAHECYLSDACEDCGFLATSHNAKDCWRGFGIDAEISYRSIPVGAYCELFGYCNVNCQFMFHCFLCANNCSYCFGSVGLKGKSYCILNKEYSKAEFFDLLPRIAAHMTETGEWGEFFPPSYSPYSYDGTMVCELFQPLSAEQLERRGYRLEQSEEQPPPPSSAVSVVPDAVSEVDREKLRDMSFLCEATGKTFKFQAKELEFHLKQNIPLPRVYWKTRVVALMHRRELIPAV